MLRITIQQLHADTEKYIRLVGQLRSPIVICDGKAPVAVLTNSSSVEVGPRKRILLPEYEAMMAELPSGNVSEDLDAIRNDR